MASQLLSRGSLGCLSSFPHKAVGLTSGCKVKFGQVLRVLSRVSECRSRGPGATYEIPGGDLCPGPFGRGVHRDDA